MARYLGSDPFIELMSFDWFGFESTAPDHSLFRDPISMMDVKNESPYDRKLRMLKCLSDTCTACSMCVLGLKPAERDNIVRDPHVLSNMNPTRFMIVGQNPGWNELEKREPFVGAAGNTFDKEIAKHGISRDDFYICNIVRCWTNNNTKPNNMVINRCKPFLHIEVGLIKPLLVVSLGAVAFGALCPGHKYSDALGKLTKSDEFDVHVFAVYHPSPLNLSDAGRRSEFNNQIRIMCGLIKALKAKHKL